VKSFHDGFKLNVVEYAEKARAQYWEESKFITCEKPVKGLGHRSLYSWKLCPRDCSKNLDGRISGRTKYKTIVEIVLQKLAVLNP
jgi:hypothetical protein